MRAICTHSRFFRSLCNQHRFTWKYLVVDEGHRLKNKDCRLMRELQAPTASEPTALRSIHLRRARLRTHTHAPTDAIDRRCVTSCHRQVSALVCALVVRRRSRLRTDFCSQRDFCHRSRRMHALICYTPKSTSKRTHSEWDMRLFVCVPVRV